MIRRLFDVAVSGSALVCSAGAARRRDRGPRRVARRPDLQSAACGPATASSSTCSSCARWSPAPSTWARAWPSTRATPDHARRGVPAAQSIDELPNLVNVLRGDMAIIGPRPTIPVAGRPVHRAPARPAGHQPGVTGWAQIHGRTALPWHGPSSSTSGTSSTASSGLDPVILWRRSGCWSTATASTRARPAAGRGRRRWCGAPSCSPSARSSPAAAARCSMSSRRNPTAGDGRRRARAARGAVPDLLAGIDIQGPTADRRQSVRERGRPALRPAQCNSTRCEYRSASSPSASGTTSSRGRRPAGAVAGAVLCQRARGAADGLPPDRELCLYTGKTDVELAILPSSSMPGTSCARCAR